MMLSGGGPMFLQLKIDAAAPGTRLNRRPRNAVLHGGISFLLPDEAAAVQARRQIRILAEAMGVADAEAVELVAGELAVNCVQHRSGSRPGRIRCYRRCRWFILEARNRCDRR